jgi:hypothetical protein
MDLPVSKLLLQCQHLRLLLWWQQLDLLWRKRHDLLQQCCTTDTKKRVIAPAVSCA